MEVTPACSCGRPLPPRHRRYCGDCSLHASALWKRARRRSDHGTRYWFDHWLKVHGSEAAAREAYNLYMRNYMRRYRAQRHRNHGRTPASGTRVPKQHFNETYAGGYAL
jgi:hypothetical protein